jgi:hypothetical protein
MDGIFLSFDGGNVIFSDKHFLTLLVKDIYLPERLGKYFFIVWIWRQESILG